MTRLALLLEVADPALADAVGALTRYLGAGGVPVVPFPQRADGVLVVSDRPAEEAVADRLTAQAGPVLLLGPTARAWAGGSLTWELCGVATGTVLAAHEIRLAPAGTGEVVARWPDGWTPTDRLPLVEKVADDVRVLLDAPVGLARHPVVTLRGAAGVCTLGETPATVADPVFARLVLRWVRAASGAVDRPAQRVGMLGYGAVGAEHALGVAATEGLVLGAVCDRNPARVSAARALAPAARAAADLDDLLADSDVVVVSTPPDSHAELAVRVLEAGRHVVVEKPFTLTVADADRVLAAADRAGRLVLCYQNRRYDPDFLALRRLVRSGALGRVFHLESFVGGFAHPCNQWHSDRAVSGGAAFDWGAHYLDWILDLLPGPVAAVTAAEHKVVWHDVTNADHTRITLHYADGAEAEFVTSEVAAAAKPKWYLLGTRGAVVGSWRHERLLGRDPVGNLVEEPFAAAESPAALSWHGADGSVSSVPLPRRPVAAFHRALADRLVSGHPLPFSAADSRRVVAVLAAAAASAAAGGRPVPPAA